MLKNSTQDTPLQGLKLMMSRGQKKMLLGDKDIMSGTISGERKKILSKLRNGCYLQCRYIWLSSRYFVV